MYREEKQHCLCAHCVAVQLTASSFLLLIVQVCARTEAPSGLLLLLISLFLHVLVVLIVRVQQLVPPGEGGGVVPNEIHVVEVVETGAGVERDQVERVHRDVVTTEREQGEKKGNSLFHSNKSPTFVLPQISRKSIFN